MRSELRMVEQFGTHLADGPTAAAYELASIEPLLSASGEIVLDFSGGQIVTIINSFTQNAAA